MNPDIFGPCTDGNFVEFFTKELEDSVATAKEGRPIFNSEHWVRVHASAGARDRPEFKMNEERKRRYKDQYETWLGRKERGETGMIGTSLLAWGVISRSRAEEFRAQGIYSVEMLAGVKDSDIHRFGPGTVTLRNQAQAYLEAAKGHAPITRLTKENEELRGQLAAMQQQMTDLTAAIVEKGAEIRRPEAPPAPAAPAADIGAMVAAAVAEALKAQGANGHKRKPGWQKGRKRTRAIAEASEESAAA